MSGKATCPQAVSRESYRTRNKNKQQTWQQKAKDSTDFLFICMGSCGEPNRYCHDDRVRMFFVPGLQLKPKPKPRHAFWHEQPRSRTTRFNSDITMLHPPTVSIVTSTLFSFDYTFHGNDQRLRFVCLFYYWYDEILWIYKKQTYGLRKRHMSSYLL
jgi:hypothetical protein